MSFVLEFHMEKLVLACVCYCFQVTILLNMEMETIHFQNNFAVSSFDAGFFNNMYKKNYTPIECSTN